MIIKIRKLLCLLKNFGTIYFLHVIYWRLKNLSWTQYEHKHLYVKNKIIKDLDISSSYFISLRKKYQESNSFNSSSKNSTKVKYKIWVFWWQGRDNLPPIVNSCVKSIEKNKGEYDLCFLSRENISDYVEIPDNYYNLLKKGKISVTHFSDILRVYLLSKFGGLWIDSTVFLTDKLDISMSNYDFYSLKNKPLAAFSVTMYKWTGFFLGSNNNSETFFLLKNLFDDYYTKFNVPLDYLLIDYLLSIIFDYCDSSSSTLERISYSNPHLHDFVLRLNEPFSFDEFNKIKKKTKIFKLSLKKKFIDYDLSGKETFYHYLLNL